MVASGRNEMKLVTSTEYNPPRLVDLIDRVKTSVRADYKRNNPSRLELISLLETVHAYIAKRLQKDEKLTVSTDKDICLGAWVYCIEAIEDEYIINNPTYKGGYLFNSGSTLYDILLKHLGINEKHQMTEKAKLYYLCKFYNFLFSNQPINDASINALQLSLLKQQLIEMMRHILSAEKEDKTRILKAIPSEKSIDLCMNKLDQDYMRQADAINPVRLLLAQLAVAICKSNPPEKCPKQRDAIYLMPRSERIKIGMLIYIMDSIHDTYWFRKAENNSDLFKLCDKALGYNFRYLDMETKLACLTALESYLNNDKNREQLEACVKEQVAAGLFGQAFYVDPVVRPILANIGKMIKKIAPDDGRIPISNVTEAAAVVGALIASAPGYGAGYAFGYGVSLTDQVGKRKNGMSGATGYAMQVLLGTSSCYYGYYAADIIVTAATERMFAKIFETLCAICGAMGAGAVTFVIYDLSFNTALQLCKLCLHLNKDLHANKISESDLMFITTLLELPPEVFPEVSKDKLRKITDTPLTSSGLSLLKPAIQPAKEVSEVTVIQDTPAAALAK